MKKEIMEDIKVLHDEREREWQGWNCLNLMTKIRQGIYEYWSILINYWDVGTSFDYTIEIYVKDVKKKKKICGSSA